VATLGFNNDGSEDRGAKNRGTEGAERVGSGIPSYTSCYSICDTVVSSPKAVFGGTRGLWVRGLLK